jgi:hypothetical protein
MKKLVIIIFLVYSNQLFSQVKYKISKDEFTNDLNITTDYIPIEKETLNLKGKPLTVNLKLDISIQYYLTETNEAPIWSLNLRYRGDLGCLSKNVGKTLLLFDDGSTLELHQVSNTDCDSKIMSGRYLFISKELFETLKVDRNIIFSTQEKYIEKILNTPLKKVRIYGTKFYADIDIEEPYKFILVDKINTITNVL